MKPEQLRKLHFDAFAFLTTVGLLRAKIDEGGSSKAAQISMMTALAFNLILSLELTLKLIHIVTTGETPENTHSCSRLYRSLPRSVQERLQQIYNRPTGGELVITTLTYTGDETPPKAPASVPLSDFESVLEYFYQLEMHTIRYSFERYKPGVWLYFLVSVNRMGAADRRANARVCTLMAVAIARENRALQRAETVRCHWANTAGPKARTADPSLDREYCRIKRDVPTRGIRSCSTPTAG